MISAEAPEGSTDREIAHGLLQYAKKMNDNFNRDVPDPTESELRLLGDMFLTTGTLAAARAQLAIETRLGEIAEQLRISNALRGTGSMGVLNSDAELRPAREAVRRLLGLEPTPVTDKEAQRIGARLAEQFSDWVDVRAIGIYHGAPEVYAERDGARRLGRLAVTAVQEASRG